jgi:hypothetical protein
MGDVRVMVESATGARRRGAGSRRRMITVASYNMRKGIGTDRRRRPDRILEVLHEIDADVVACRRRIAASARGCRRSRSS